MAAVTAAMVKELRESTGAGMMECKKALTETDGDMEAAVDVLRKSGAAKVEKKAGRIAAEGIVKTVVKDDKVAAIVEVNSETDFVAKNDDFMSFVKTVADTIIEKNPADVDALLAEKAADSDMTVAELLQEKVLTIGENIKIRRFARYEGAVATYIHAGGKIGVMVNFETDVAVVSYTHLTLPTKLEV